MCQHLNLYCFVFVDEFERSLSSLFKKQNSTTHQGLEQTLVKLTIFAQQMKFDGVKKQFNLSDGLVNYLNNTRIRDVLWCYNTGEDTTVRDLFEQISYLDTRESVVESKIKVFKHFNITTPTVSSLHELCPLLPTLFLTLYSKPTFLTIIAATKYMTLTEFMDIMKKMDCTVQYQHYAIRLSMGDKITANEFAKTLKLKALKFLETIVITRNTQSSMKPIDVAAKFHNVTTNVLIHIFSDQVFGVSLPVFHYFNTPVGNITQDLPNSVSVPMNLAQISVAISQKYRSVHSGAKYPLIFVGHSSGISTWARVSTYTLMQLSMISANTTKGFLTVAFTISKESVDFMSKTTIAAMSQLLGSKGYSEPNIKTQFFTLPFLSSVPSKSAADIRQHYFAGVKFVKSHYTFGHVADVLSMNKSTVLKLPLHKVYNTYFGMNEAEMQYSLKQVSGNDFTLLKDSSYGEINDTSDIFSMKISDIEDQLIKKIRSGLLVFVSFVPSLFCLCCSSNAVMFCILG